MKSLAIIVYHRENKNRVNCSEFASIVDNTNPEYPGRLYGDGATPGSPACILGNAVESKVKKKPGIRKRTLIPCFNLSFRTVIPYFNHGRGSRVLSSLAADVGTEANT
jgi:hypothetical protein